MGNGGRDCCTCRTNGCKLASTLKTCTCKTCRARCNSSASKILAPMRTYCCDVVSLKSSSACVWPLSSLSKFPVIFLSLYPHISTYTYAYMHICVYVYKILLDNDQILLIALHSVSCRFTVGLSLNRWDLIIVSPSPVSSQSFLRRTT